jgi:hypothetical protein
MAFPYKELKYLVRYKAKDHNEITFSDYEIKMATNEVLRYLSNSYALKNSDFLERSIVLDEDAMNTDVLIKNADIEREAETNGEEPELLESYDFKTGGVELPDDLVTLVAVMSMRTKRILTPCEGIQEPEYCEYKVENGRIYSGDRCIKLQYRTLLHEISEDEDLIELPNLWKDAVAKLVHMVLGQTENDILLEAVNDAVDSLVPRRRYRNAHVKLPFKV